MGKPTFTDDDAAVLAARKVLKERFHPRLDIIDGAASILHPIIDGFNTAKMYVGKFLKDYKPMDW